MRTTLRLLSFLKPFWGWVLLSVLVGVATIASSIGLLGTSAFLIASAALHPSVGELQVAIVGVRFFGIARAVFRYLERLVSHSVNFLLLGNLRSWFYRAIEPLAPARLLKIQSGDILQRAIGDIDTLENFYVRVVAPPVTAVMVTSGISLFVGRYAASLGWTLLGGLTTGMILIPLLAYGLGKGPGKAYIESRAQLNAALLESVQGLADIQVFNHLSATNERIQILGGRFVRAQFGLNAGSAGLNALNLLFTNLTLLAVLWLAVPLVRAGVMDGVSLAVVGLLTTASFEAVTPLAQAAQLFQSSLQAARRLFSLADQIPAVSEAPNPIPLFTPVDTLSLKAVHFSYEPESHPVLTDIDLEITRGKKVAVVGASGAGKSSLINVLLRFWEFQQGAYHIGAQDARQLSGADVRSCFSVISQATYLFSSNIRTNLSMAQPDASDAQLMAVMKRAGLNDWLAQLPQGLDTWVGEHAVQVSGGERQRLAIARALLQTTPFVLLDEPTAGVDAINELALMDEMLDLFANRGVLWVTHRLVRMEQMDEIVVLAHGRIIERGAHAQLLAQAGQYAQIWNEQRRRLEE